MRIVSEQHKSLVNTIYTNPELIEKGMKSINSEKYHNLKPPHDGRYVAPDILCQDIKDDLVVVEVALSFYSPYKMGRYLFNRKKFLEERGGGRIIYVVKKPPRKTSDIYKIFKKYDAEFKLIEDIGGNN